LKEGERRRRCLRNPVPKRRTQRRIRRIRRIAAGQREISLSLNGTHKGSGGSNPQSAPEKTPLAKSQ